MAEVSYGEVLNLLRADLGAANKRIELLEAVRDAAVELVANCFSDQEVRLALMVGNGPAMCDLENENATSLKLRCDRIEAAFKHARKAIAAVPKE